MLKQGESFRWPGFRIKFDPEWCPSLPYATYRGCWRGGMSAERRFGTLQYAMAYLGISPKSKPDNYDAIEALRKSEIQARLSH